jgi:hypothetical protein
MLMSREEQKREHKTKSRWGEQTEELCKTHGFDYKSLVAPPHIATSRTFNALPLREQMGIAFHCRVTPALLGLETSQSIGRMRYVIQQVCVISTVGE